LGSIRLPKLPGAADQSGPGKVNELRAAGKRLDQEQDQCENGGDTVSCRVPVVRQGARIMSADDQIALLVQAVFLVMVLKDARKCHREGNNRRMAFWLGGFVLALLAFVMFWVYR
jgi:hypothetical protein